MWGGHPNHSPALYQRFLSHPTAKLPWTVQRYVQQKETKDLCLWKRKVTCITFLNSRLVHGEKDHWKKGATWWDPALTGSRNLRQRTALLSLHKPGLFVHLSVVAAHSRVMLRLGGSCGTGPTLTLGSISHFLLGFTPCVPQPAPPPTPDQSCREMVILGSLFWYYLYIPVASPWEINDFSIPFQFRPG